MRQLLSGAIVAVVLSPIFMRVSEMKLDPEEQIIAAALDQAELDDANERGVGAQIEFRQEGHAKVTMTISRELVERARALELTVFELVVHAFRLVAPRAFDITRALPPRLH